MSSITAMIVDDHPCVRYGIRQLLTHTTPYYVVAEATSGYEALQQAERHQPSVILMDVQLPGLSGLCVAPILRKRLPKSHIIVLSSHDDDAYVYQAAMVGAAAYIMKDDAPERLVTAIGRVVAGEHPIVETVLERPGIASRLLSNLRDVATTQRHAPSPDDDELPLTIREIEVLDCILHGYTNRESAEALFITQQTVKNHMTRMLGKFDATTRLDLVRHALRHGWMLIGSPAPEQSLEHDVVVSADAAPSATTRTPSVSSRVAFLDTGATLSAVTGET